MAGEEGQAGVCGPAIRRRAARGSARGPAIAVVLAMLAPLPACTGLRADADAPRSIAVVCAPGHLDVDCFRQASELCGRAGYDLFDAQGRRATVADAQFGALEARCRKQE